MKKQQFYKTREMTFQIEEPGYKFQMNDVAASIAISGLKNSDKWLDYRRQIADYYTSNLKCTTISGGSYWLYGIMVGDRDKVARELKEAGIETNLCHIRNDEFTVFKIFKNHCPNMDKLELEYLYIPINIKMSFDDAKYIVKNLNEIIKKHAKRN